MGITTQRPATLKFSQGHSTLFQTTCPRTTPSVHLLPLWYLQMDRRRIDEREGWGGGGVLLLKSVRSRCVVDPGSAAAAVLPSGSSPKLLVGAGSRLGTDGSEGASPQTSFSSSSLAVLSESSVRLQLILDPMRPWPR